MSQATRHQAPGHASARQGDATFTARDLRFSRRQDPAHQVDGVEDWQDKQPGESDGPDSRLGLALGTAVHGLVCATPFITLMGRCGPLAARCVPFGEVGGAGTYLFGRRVRVDSHGAGGGRNWDDPITRHRNAGCSSERVAHFLRGLYDALWLCREHYVFARISSKCRCAKRERQHDACTSTRPAEHATESASCFHASIVILFHIWHKYIRRGFGTKNRHFQS